jgi:hypothetical protein
MDLYPLNLVLAVTVGSATLFFGYLPIRRLEAEFFLRQILRFGAGWLAVAACSPPEILHYDLLLALLCFIAWWRLRAGHGFSGKIWFCAAAGLGISLGPVLILAVRTDAPPGPLLFHLVLLYLGGSISGLAWVLYIFTRPAASEAGVSVAALPSLLLGFTLLRAATFFLTLLGQPPMNPGGSALLSAPEILLNLQPIALGLFLFVILLVLPCLAAWARKRCRSPRPSTAGAILLAVGILAFGSECLACWFGV